jgi:hypothetical protein
MQTLAANTTINLGPFPRGATLRIDLPKTNNIYEWPSLNGSHISLAFAPKNVTLAAGKVYRLTAGTVQITYTIL